MLFHILIGGCRPAGEYLLAQLGEKFVHPALRLLHHFGDAEVYNWLFRFYRRGERYAFLVEALGQFCKIFPVHAQHIGDHIQPCERIVEHYLQHREYALTADSVLLHDYLAVESHFKLEELVLVIVLEALHIRALETELAAQLINAAYAVNYGVRHYRVAFFLYAVDYLFDILHCVHGIYHIYEHEQPAEIQRDDMLGDKELL